MLDVYVEVVGVCLFGWRVCGWLSHGVGVVVVGGVVGVVVVVVVAVCVVVFVCMCGCVCLVCCF